MERCFLLIILLTALGCNQPPDDALSSLKAAIKDELSQTNGDFAVAYKNPDHPADTIFIHPRENFHAASTMKTPVLLEVYKQAEAGKFQLSDVVPVKNEFRSIVDSSLYSLTPEDDSYDALYAQEGDEVSIYDLSYYMIMSSSNLATNIIIDLVGAKNVTQTLRNMGAKDIQVLRGVEDLKAYEQGMNNTTTAYDLMLLFENIERHRTVSDTSSQAMIRILLDQKFNEIIPGNLPDDVKIAHKTGWITGVHHDSGIVYLPDGQKYILILLSKNVEDEKVAVASMAKVSRLIYDYQTSARRAIE